MVASILLIENPPVRVTKESINEPRLYNLRLMSLGLVILSRPRITELRHLKNHLGQLSFYTGGN